MVSSEPPQPGQRSGWTGLDDSRREFRLPFLVLALTTGIAGFVDAFAYLSYGAFVANQSSNVVFLGIGPAGRHPTWPAAAASLVAFAAGAGVVTRLRATRSRWSAPVRVLVATVIATSVWAVLNVLLQYGRHGPQARIALSALGGFAMGCLATLFVRTAGVATTITYQSGTVAKTGERIVSWLAGPGVDRTKARRASLLGLLTLVGYAVGGGIGTLAQQRPLWVPAWATLALVAVMFMVRPNPARTRSHT
ncbi:YoaK family protein [Micromonospora sp. NPDC051296]|uniref:YoaK family protein n=1 Tax=Micromonospora sp. NPDC051296 TaxID=3155046 RepID=UPI003442D873